MNSWLSDVVLGSQSDERLVSLARAGHDGAFVAIVRRYAPELRAQAEKRGPRGQAEDIVQQAFLSAFTALRGGAEVGHLRGWLYRIVGNAATKTAARTPRDEELSDEVSVTEPSEHEAERGLLVKAMLAEIASLPEHQRDALVKTVVQGRSRREVAFSMGLTEGAVRQLVYRARATLRTAVTAITPYPITVWAAGARGAPELDQPAQIAVGAGTASAGAVVIKAGAVFVATGVIAAGVVSSSLHRHPQHIAVASRPGLMPSTGHDGARQGSVISYVHPLAAGEVDHATQSSGQVRSPTLRPGDASSQPSSRNRKVATSSTPQAGSPAGAVSGNGIATTTTGSPSPTPTPTPTNGGDSSTATATTASDPSPAPTNDTSASSDSSSPTTTASATPSPSPTPTYQGQATPPSPSGD